VISRPRQKTRNMALVMLTLLLWIFLSSTTNSKVQAFISKRSPLSLSSPQVPSSSLSLSHQAAARTSIITYEYDGWNLSYRYKPPSTGHEKSPPLLLIHPIGIGLSSWFWDRFLESWTGSAVYAPNLIGCGVSEGGDAWDPDKRGLSIPLGWVKGCESLMKEISTQQFDSPSNKIEWKVFAQGGLAPVGVMIAARNPDSPCDTTWLDSADREIGPESRPPVMVFNSGFCLHRSYEEELRTLCQSTLILSGQDDKRQLQEYVQFMKECELKVLPGQNVLPWESPREVAEAVTIQ